MKNIGIPLSYEIACAICPIYYRLTLIFSNQSIIWKRCPMTIFVGALHVKTAESHFNQGAAHLS